MGKDANTAGRPDDPDLAPDAALAEDLGDEEERRKEQLKYFGGDEDDIDDFDPTGLDDGSVIGENFTPPAKDEDEKEEDDDDVAEQESQGDDEPGEAEADAEEAEADEDEAEGEDDGRTPEKDEKPQGIPKHRFDEVNERRKAAEEELARLKAEREAETKAEKEEYDFDAAEMEYQELLLDGKTDEALAKRKEIRAAEHAAWKTETKTETQSEISAQEQADEVSGLSVEAEKMFPVFDENHEDYDDKITNKVLVYYRGYLSSGEYNNLGDAFVQALTDVVEQYDLTGRYGITFDGQPAADPTPEPKPTGKKKEDPGKEKVRSKAHQPVAGQGEGAIQRGVATPNIAEMSDDDLDKLSDEQIARLRGDFL